MWLDLLESQCAARHKLIRRSYTGLGDTSLDPRYECLTIATHTSKVGCAEQHAAVLHLMPIEGDLFQGTDGFYLCW